MSNSLSAVHPELIAEWSEKNLPLLCKVLAAKKKHNLFI